MKETVLKGKAWVFGDNINAEAIMPTGTDVDPRLAVGHVLEHYNPDFAKKVQKGDFIVAGRNFGHSSSRPAGEVLRMAGVAAVICESSGRIFFRNTWNMGLPVLQSPGVTKKVSMGDALEVDVASGTIKNLTTGEQMQTEPTIPLLLQRWEVGGMIPWIKSHKEDYPGIRKVK